MVCVKFYDNQKVAQYYIIDTNIKINNKSEYISSKNFQKKRKN